MRDDPVKSAFFAAGIAVALLAALLHEMDALVIEPAPTFTCPVTTLESTT
jgi:hypothetical protein